MKDIENKAIIELETYSKAFQDKKRCFPWSSNLEGFVETKLRKHDPEGWIEMLISEGILEEPVLGRLRFTYNGIKLGENMNEIKKSSNEVKGEVSNKTEESKPAVEDTKNTQETRTKNDGNGTDAGETITDASEVLTGSGKYDYPLLEEYLGDLPRKQGILSEVEIIDGVHGESSRLTLDDTVYRSSSSVILDECKQLQKGNLFPYRVCVEKIHGKKGNVFHTLNGGTGE